MKLNHRCYVGGWPTYIPTYIHTYIDTYIHTKCAAAWSCHLPSWRSHQDPNWAKLGPCLWHVTFVLEAKMAILERSIYMCDILDRSIFYIRALYTSMHIERSLYMLEIRPHPRRNSNLCGVIHHATERSVFPCRGCCWYNCGLAFTPWTECP